MKHIYTLLITLLITSLGFGQTTQIYSLDFETAGGYTTSLTEYTDGSEDYFIRTDESNIGSAMVFTNKQGNFFFAAHDIDSEGASANQQLTIDNIDITGYENLQLRVYLAEDDDGANQDWDAGDFVVFSVDIDNTSTFTDVLNVTAPSTNTEPRITFINGSATGSGANITDAFQQFTSTFSGTGSSMDLQIDMSFNSGDEDVAIDGIEIWGDLVGGGCAAPTTQASAYNTTSIGESSATLNWTSGDGDEVLVVVKEGSAVDTDPTDGVAYTGNLAFGSGTELGTGNYTVQAGSAATSASITGLFSNTTYHVAVYEYNTLDTCYLTPALTGSFTTADCALPEAVAFFTATAGNANTDLSWTNGLCFDEILVVAKEILPVTATPSGDGTAYTADAAFGSGTDLGSGEYAVYKGIGTSVTVTGLTNGTEYFFSAFVRKGTAWTSAMSDSATPVAPTLGWQITAEDTSFVIDFDSTVSGVNEGAFDASGFTSSPTTGQLDSDAWESTGMSDGDLSYGGSVTSVDYARGTSTGGVTSGGFYAFDTGGSNNSLGFQGTGSDFTPGTITLRVQNQTGNTVTAADLAYLIYVYNDQGRGNSFNFSYSSDDTTYTAVGALDFTSEEIADGVPAWASTSRSTYISGLSIADGDYLYLRWSSSDEIGGGSRDEIAVDDIDLKFNPVTTTYTFTGTWAPSDPNGTASAGDDIVIASGDATIDTNTTCNSVTVNPGAGLTVDTGITLTTSNGLVLESTSTTYSSLILDGTIAGAGVITYDRHVNVNGSGTTGSNDLISAPLTGQAFSAFATANPNILSNGAGTLFLFGPFDKTTGEYVTYADTESATLDAGIGYRAASDDNDTFTFTGAANNGDLDVTILNSGPQETEWNLIGNPYPSYLNVQDFLNHEVSPGVSNLSLFDAGTAAIYGYDGSALNGWTIYNLATTTASTVIAPGQGFFVSSASASSTVEFTPAMRSTGTTDDFIAGRQGTLVFMTLNMSTATDSYSTDIYFSPGASLGFDIGFDAEFFGSAPAFALFSLLVEDDEGNPLTLQAVGSDDLGDVTIPLGVNANQGEQLTFTIANLQLPATTEVYLDDMVANTSTLLTASDYVLTPSTALSGSGRFFLRFFDSTLSIFENNTEDVSITALNTTKELVINGQLQEGTVLNLFDIQGRIVLTTKLDAGSLENRIDVSSLVSGVYVAQVLDNTQQKSQKVILGN